MMLEEKEKQQPVSRGISLCVSGVSQEVRTTRRFAVEISNDFVFLLDFLLIGKLSH